MMFALFLVGCRPEGSVILPDFLDPEVDEEITTFGDFRCLDPECTEHQEGFDWAESLDIKDEELCTSPWQAFTEGCRAYVRAPYEDALPEPPEVDDEEERKE